MIQYKAIKKTKTSHNFRGWRQLHSHILLIMIACAKIIKERNGQIILVTNRSMAEQQKPSPSVLDYADVILDNYSYVSDFTANISTSLSAFLLQCYIMCMTYEMHSRGIDLPVRISINTDKGLVYTEKLNQTLFQDTLI